MTDSVIGPSFAADLAAAGLLGLPFAWSAEGVTYSDDLSAEQREAIEAVVDAHDPARPDPAAIAAECSRRILARVSTTAQANITAFVVDLTASAIAGDAVTPDPSGDIALARAIRLWISGPSGMLATSRALIAAADPTFQDDGHWPSWPEAWTTFVSRF